MRVHYRSEISFFVFFETQPSLSFHLILPIISPSHITTLATSQPTTSHRNHRPQQHFTKKRRSIMPNFALYFSFMCHVTSHLVHFHLFRAFGISLYFLSKKTIKKQILRSIVIKRILYSLLQILVKTSFLNTHP